MNNIEVRVARLETWLKSLLGYDQQSDGIIQAMIEDMKTHMEAYHQRLKIVEEMKSDVKSTNTLVKGINDTLYTLVTKMQGETGSPEKGFFARLRKIEDFMKNHKEKVSQKIGFLRLIVTGSIGGLVVGIVTFLLNRFT